MLTTIITIVTHNINLTSPIIIVGLVLKWRGKVLERYKEIERTIITNYRKKIWNKFVKGVKEYKMIQEGDKIAVCLSGGKDSMLLAKCMQELQRHGEIKFELKFLCMNPRVQWRKKAKNNRKCKHFKYSNHNVWNRYIW